jgi:hypothetical protein|tara:strand:- start:7343 stop:9415 length:2073 start_codon:yes stop_codon:yes gene_type:complete
MSKELEQANLFIDPGEFESLKSPRDGFDDPNGAFPKARSIGLTGVNPRATGAETGGVYLGGGSKGVGWELAEEVGAEYPLCQVKETSAGHIQEFDDTYGRERIMLRHKTGAGVEMFADGTVAISSTKNCIRTVVGDEKVKIEGDAELIYSGNVTMRVAGDFNLDIGGNFKTFVGGDILSETRGSFLQDVEKNVDLRVVGDKAQSIAGSSTETVLGNKFSTVKVDHELEVGGRFHQNVGDEIVLTSENEIVIATRDLNLSASSLTLAGDSGHIGGDEIVMYGKTAHVPRINATEMTATTFRGDLVGTATQAIDANQSKLADIANGLGSGAGTGGHSATDSTATNKVTANVTKAVMQEILNKTDLGIRRIQIDPNDDFAEKIDRSRNYGGLSKVDLTTERARSKLRDPNNLKNQKFTGSLVAANIISKNFAVPTPIKFGRIVGPEKNIMRGVEDIGTQDGKAKTFKVQSTRTGDLPNYTFKTTFVPDHKYNVLFQSDITPRTRLADGISMAKFLGSYADPVTMNSVNDKEDRFNLAKQYMLHAEAMKTINEATGTKEFANFRLEVLEGFYVPEATETLDTTDGVNHFKTNGQTVVYHLINNDGDIATQKTFDLAMYWKDHLNFEKLTIDYDTYNPDGTLHACIILKMPKIVAPWTVTYENVIETRFNNTVQTTNELMEILDSTENIENIVVT